MADLSVDYQALLAAERALDRISRQLEASEACRDDLADVWGSRKVGDAMWQFVGNWDRHRKGLVADIATVGTMCGETWMAFQRIERDLNAAITVERGPS